MLRSKKAITPAFNMIIAAVAAMLILLVLIVILRAIGQKTEDQSEKARCKMSVTAYARLNSMPVRNEVHDERSIDCPTKFVTIKKSTPRKMRTDIANMMVECWDNYGEGNLELFTLGKRYCALCTVFQFKDESVRLTGLPGFMMVEPAPVVREDWRPTYYEFITGEKSTQFLIDKAKGSADLNALEGDKRYAVVFITGVNVNVPSIVFKIVNVFYKTTVNIASQLVVGEYSEQGLKDLGCTSLPVSMLEGRFK